MQGISYQVVKKMRRQERLATAGRYCHPRAGRKNREVGPSDGRWNLTRAAWWKVASWRRGAPSGTWNHGDSAAARDPPRGSVRKGEAPWLLSSSCLLIVHHFLLLAEPTGRQLGSTVSCNSEQRWEAARMDLRANRRIIGMEHKSIWVYSSFHY